MGPRPGRVLDGGPRAHRPALLHPAPQPPLAGLRRGGWPSGPSWPGQKLAHVSPGVPEAGAPPPPRPSAPSFTPWPAPRCPPPSSRSTWPSWPVRGLETPRRTPTDPAHSTGSESGTRGWGSAGAALRGAGLQPRWCTARRAPGQVGRDNGALGTRPKAAEWTQARGLAHRTQPKDKTGGRRPSPA